MTRSPSTNSARAQLALALLVIGVGAYILCLASTVWGAGITNDSLMYLTGARQLAAGNGYMMPERLADGRAVWQPIWWWPPMFSMALGALARLGADPLAAARHLNAALLGVNAVLVGLIVAHATRDVRSVSPGETVARRSPWPAVLAATLAATMLDLVSTHGFVWSEPLFNLLALLALRAVAADVERPRWWLLVGAAGCAGAAYLTRYAGVALIGSGGLALLLLGGQTRFRTRLLRAVIFGGVAGLAPLAWVTRNWLVGAPSAGRPFQYDPLWYEKLGDLLDVARHWVVPASLADRLYGDPQLVWVVVAAAAVASLVWWLGRRGERAVPWPWLAGVDETDDDTDRLPDPPSRRTAVLGTFFLFALIYPLFVTLSLTFFDPALYFDQRMLAPVLLALIACGTIFISRAVHDLRSRQFRRLAAGLGVGLLAWASLGFALVVLGDNFYATLDRVSISRERGSGFAADKWRRSETMAFLRDKLGPEAVIYSNLDKVLPALTRDRISAKLPGTGDDVSAMRATLERTHGVVVYFRHAPVSLGTYPAKALAERLDLYYRETRSGDAVVLRVPADVKNGRR